MCCCSLVDGKLWFWRRSGEAEGKKGGGKVPSDFSWCERWDAKRGVRELIIRISIPSSSSLCLSSFSISGSGIVERVMGPGLREISDA